METAPEVMIAKQVEDMGSIYYQPLEGDLCLVLQFLDLKLPGRGFRYLRPLHVTSVTPCSAHPGPTLLVYLVCGSIRLCPSIVL